MHTFHEIPIPEETRSIYVRALTALQRAGVDFLIGGAFAMHCQAGRFRATKDLDLFLPRAAVASALRILHGEGFTVELTDPSWIAKARRSGELVDLIFCSCNGLLPVDEVWLARGREATILGVPARVVAPEEMLVSKSFVAARDRFDGADVSWLIRRLGSELDWRRIEALVADHWEVLLWQVIHYLYVFPAHRAQVPAPLVQRLLRRMSRALGAPTDLPCRGPMLDAQHYLEESRAGTSPAGVPGDPLGAPGDPDAAGTARDGLL